VTKDGISYELKNGVHEISSFAQYYDLLGMHSAASGITIRPTEQSLSLLLYSLLL
jgi:hypothetical protein